MKVLVIEEKNGQFAYRTQSEKGSSDKASRKGALHCSELYSNDSPRIFLLLPTAQFRQLSVSYLLVTEALEWPRNMHGTVIHSYDPINDQENAEIQLEFQDESSLNKMLNEQVPSEPAVNPQTTENHGPAAVTMYNQPTEPARSLNKMQPTAYNRVLSWTRNKMKNLKRLKSQNVEPFYLFMTGGGGSRKSD